MTWVKACKQYQLQRGEGAKYIVPKKGSDEYEIVKKIFESMEKPPKKEKTKKIAEQPIEPAVVAEPPVQKPVPKKIVSIDTSSLMQEVNRAGVIETEQDIEDYLSALKTKLTDLVNSNNKVRFK